MKKAINILLVLMLFFSAVTYCFAEEIPSTSGEKSVTVTTDNIPKPRRSCFDRGEGILTLVKDRSLLIEAEAYAYHNVDRIRMTINLEKTDGYNDTTVKTWTVSDYNVSSIEFAKGHVVDSAGYYRITIFFSTQHAGDGGGTEGATASSSWMWVD